MTTKKKYEVSVEMNKVNYAWQTYAIEADNPEEALKTYYEGDIINEEYELDWSDSGGRRPEPLIREVKGFDLDWTQEAKKKIEAYEEFLRNIRDNWDCDTGAYATHHRQCRCCEAKRLLKGTKYEK